MQHIDLPLLVRCAHNPCESQSYRLRDGIAHFTSMHDRPSVVYTDSTLASIGNYGVMYPPRKKTFDCFPDLRLSAKPCGVVLAFYGRTHQSIAHTWFMRRVIECHRDVDGCVLRSPLRIGLPIYRISHSMSTSVHSSVPGRNKFYCASHRYHLWERFCAS